MFLDWVCLKDGNVFGYYSGHSFGAGRLRGRGIGAEDSPPGAVAEDSEAAPGWT